MAYKTSELVPENGIYSVHHAAHRLPPECTLLRGQTFPRCCKCADEVSFELLQIAPEMNRRNRVVLYELPVLDDDIETVA